MCLAGNPYSDRAWVKHCEFAKCQHKSFGVGVQKQAAKGCYRSIMVLAFSVLSGSRHMDETFPSRKAKQSKKKKRQFSLSSYAAVISIPTTSMRMQGKEKPAAVSNRRRKWWRSSTTEQEPRDAGTSSERRAQMCFIITM
jgi:hypothetical protein